MCQFKLVHMSLHKLDVQVPNHKTHIVLQHVVCCYAIAILSWTLQHRCMLQSLYRMTFVNIMLELGACCLAEICAHKGKLLRMMPVLGCWGGWKEHSTGYNESSTGYNERVANYNESSAIYKPSSSCQHPQQQQPHLQQRWQQRLVHRQC